MIRRVSVAAAAAIILAAGNGCAAARYVQRQPGEGVVAIPDNSNFWPTYNRDQALKLIQEHVGPDYEIVKEEAVVTGQVTTTDQQTTETPLQNRKTQAPAGTQTTVAQTTRTTDATQWYIHYRRRQGAATGGAVVPTGGPPGVNGGVVPAAATGGAVVPTGGPPGVSGGMVPAAGPGGVMPPGATTTGGMK